METTRKVAKISSQRRKDAEVAMEQRICSCVPAGDRQLQQVRATLRRAQVGISKQGTFRSKDQKTRRSPGSESCLQSGMWLVLLLCSLLPSLAFGEAGSVSPGINSNYVDPDFERWRDTFESPGREVYDRRHAILEALDLRKGMEVADIGAGTGLFTRLFAQEVGPEGTVYAVDIAPSFVEGTLRTARAQGLNNVEGVVNSQRSVHLPAGSIDLAFTSDTYHHFEYPGAMLESIYRALRSGGELVIIDFRKQPGVASGWVMGHVRADSGTVRDEVTAAGFEYVGAREDLLRTNYFMRFRKPPK